MAISRRDLLRAGAMGTGLAVLGRFLSPEVRAVPRGATKLITTVRYDASSSEGKKMLKIYASAVAVMMSKPLSDPLSWDFQWYIHAIPPNTTKAAALQGAFGAVMSPQRQLAEQVWNTCEPHASGNDGAFLPWHRMFVMYFEQIIRTVSNVPTFTLPYWDYIDPNCPGNCSVLPEEFRKKDDPVWGALYRADRFDYANNGTPIDQIPGNELSLDCMKQAQFISAELGGFTTACDGNPHGQLHSDVGNSLGMGSVRWAARDPIFWLHHCNIDRIWASWNKSGGGNPTDHDFLEQTFVFASGNGQRTSAKAAAVLDTATLSFPYAYQTYLERPSGSVPFSRPKAFAQVLHAESLNAKTATPKPIELGATPTVVSLVANVDSKKGATPRLREFTSQIDEVPVDHAFYLVLADIKADREPETSYSVYLDLPTGTTPNRKDVSYVGTLSFFGVGVQGMEGMHRDRNGGPKVVSFIVTDVVRQLRKTGRLTGAPTITLVPSRVPVPGSAPKIGRISLQSN